MPFPEPRFRSPLPKEGGWGWVPLRIHPPPTPQKQTSLPSRQALPLSISDSGPLALSPTRTHPATSEPPQSPFPSSSAQPPSPSRPRSPSQPSHRPDPGQHPSPSPRCGPRPQTAASPAASPSAPPPSYPFHQSPSIQYPAFPPPRPPPRHPSPNLSTLKVRLFRHLRQCRLSEAPSPREGVGGGFALASGFCSRSRPSNHLPPFHLPPPPSPIPHSPLTPSPNLRYNRSPFPAVQPIHSRPVSPSPRWGPWSFP